jgi:hypothetical protein
MLNILNDCGNIVETAAFWLYMYVVRGRRWQWVSLVELELLTLQKHMNSLPVFSGVRTTRYLVLYVCFVDCCLFFCTFSFGRCVVCSSIYDSDYPFWYLQTLLKMSFEARKPKGLNKKAKFGYSHMYHRWIYLFLHFTNLNF